MSLEEVCTLTMLKNQRKSTLVNEEKSEMVAGGSFPHEQSLRPTPGWPAARTHPLTQRLSPHLGLQGTPRSGMGAGG